MLKFNNKIILLLFLGLIICAFFIFNINSKAELLQTPSDYSFNASLSAFLQEEEFEFMKSRTDKIYSIYENIKEIEKKYADSKDEDSLKVLHFTNLCLDLYYDIWFKKPINEQNYLISDEDYIFLLKKEPDFRIIYNMLFLFIPPKENFIDLNKELNTRLNLVRSLKNDLSDKNIKASISLKDVEFEILSYSYIDYPEAPNYINDFHNEFIEIISAVDRHYDAIYAQNPDLINNLNQENVKTDRQLWKERKATYWKDINNLDSKYRNRYLLKAKEINNNGDVMINFYTAYKYSDGNKYYWNIDKIASDDKIIKEYTKYKNKILMYSDR